MKGEIRGRIREYIIFLMRMFSGVVQLRKKGVRSTTLYIPLFSGGVNEFHYDYFGLDWIWETPQVHNRRNSSSS